jgi:Tol biopolymer transport system component
VLGAVLRDQFKNLRPELPTATVTNLVDAAVAVGTGNRVSATNAFGRSRIRFAGAGTSDSVFVSVVPQGTIAVTMSDYPGIEVVGLDGSDARPLSRFASELFLFATFPDWAPDGSVMALEMLSNAGESGVVTMDSLGAYRFVVPRSYPNFIGPPHYTADGQWVYYSRSASLDGPEELWRVHPDGSGVEKVFTPAPGGTDWIDPRLAPDGHSLFVNAFDGTSFFSARLDPVTGYATRFPDGYINPTFSAAANLVVIETRLGQLALVKPDGTQFHVLTVPLSESDGDGHQGYPSWSPDGKWLVAHDETLGRPVVVRVSDGAIVPILPGQSTGAAAWRPR